MAENVFIISLFNSCKSRVMLFYIIDSFDQKENKNLVLSTFLGSGATYNDKIWQSYVKLIQTKTHKL